LRAPSTTMADALAAVDLTLALGLAFQDKQRITMLVPPHVVLHAPSTTTADALAAIDATGHHKPAGRQSLAQCLVALIGDNISHVLRVLTFPSSRVTSPSSVYPCHARRARKPARAGAHRLTGLVIDAAWMPLGKVTFLVTFLRS